ncbi:MAG: DUF928 domain-containing protein [Xenococcaceae cyanobacterium]
MNIFSKNNWSSIAFFTLCSYVGLISALRAFAEVNTVVLFQPPPQEEQPESTEGAASRQNQLCPQDRAISQQQKSSDNRLNLTAVVPDSNYGLTVANRPSFWVYLPKTSAQKAILSIKEEGIKSHWQQPVNLTGEGGITRIKLSKNAPALEIGKNYQWAVILVCGNRPNPNDPVVAAWIKRIDRSTITRYISPLSTELEKAAIYARKGIWYNALDILSQAQKPSLNNWQDIWVQYLQSGGLEELADEPIIIRQ